MPPKCVFCEKQAHVLGFIEPPMCLQHYRMAVLISLLRSYGAEVSLQSLALVAHRLYPRLKSDELPELAKPMLEVA